MFVSKCKTVLLLLLAALFTLLLVLHPSKARTAREQKAVEPIDRASAEWCEVLGRPGRAMGYPSPLVPLISPLPPFQLHFEGRPFPLGTSNDFHETNDAPAARTAV